MLISDSYKLLNRQLHEERPDYGTNGRAVVQFVTQYAQQLGCKTVLDYGCGKGTLKNALEMLCSELEVREYDPAIEGKDEEPEPADLVVCSDVLEHVEPESLLGVVWDISRKSRKGAFITVHTGPAHKILPDGRNAHLTQQPSEWWLNLLFQYFRLRIAMTGPHHLGTLLVPREAVIRRYA